MRKTIAIGRTLQFRNLQTSQSNFKNSFYRVNMEETEVSRIFLGEAEHARRNDQ